MRELEDRLAQFEQRFGPLESPPPAFHQEPAPVWPAYPPPPPPSSFQPVEPYPTPPRKDWERLLGGNWLAKAGMLVLVLGVVFFLKYAFDRDWIGLTGRILLGAAGGLALAALGDLLLARRRYGVYPQVLAGGGALITYFSVYAAAAFEDYREATGITFELDAVLLGLVALGLAAYAVLRRTPVLLVEAVLLGATTSLVAERWDAFSVLYIVLLAAVVAVAGAWRKWSYVPVVALAAATATLFFDVLVDVDPLAVSLGAAALVVVFVVVSAGRAEPADAAIGTALALGAFVAPWLVTIAALEESPHAWARGPATALLAVTALLLALLPKAPRHARFGWGVAAPILALWWPPIQFDGVNTAYAWSGLLLAAVLLAHARPHVLTRGPMIAAAALLTVHLVAIDAPDVQSGDLDRWWAFAAFLPATLLAFLAWRVEARSEKDSAPTARVLLGIGLLLPLVYLLVALEGYAISIAWAAEAVLFVVIGFAFRVRDLRIASFALFGLVLFRVFLFDLVDLELQYRALVFLAVGALLVGASFLFARQRAQT